METSAYNTKEVQKWVEAVYELCKICEVEELENRVIRKIDRKKTKQIQKMDEKRDRQHQRENIHHSK